MEALVADVKKAKIPAASKLFYTKLESVLEGTRDLSIAGDTDLFFMDAVELYLLLEGLQY